MRRISNGSVNVGVLEWLKAQGPGYRRRTNAILRAYNNAASQGRKNGDWSNFGTKST